MIYTKKGQPHPPVGLRSRLGRPAASLPKPAHVDALNRRHRRSMTTPRAFEDYSESIGGGRRDFTEGVAYGPGQRVEKIDVWGPAAEVTRASAPIQDPASDRPSGGMRFPWLAPAVVSRDNGAEGATNGSRSAEDGAAASNVDAVRANGNGAAAGSSTSGKPGGNGKKGIEDSSQTSSRIPWDQERWRPSTYGAPLLIQRLPGAASQSVGQVAIADRDAVRAGQRSAEASAAHASEAAAEFGALIEDMRHWESMLNGLERRAKGMDTLVEQLGLLKSDSVPLVHPPSWMPEPVATKDVFAFPDTTYEERTSYSVIPEWREEIHPATGTGHEVLLQSYNWESWREGFYHRITREASWYKELGFSLVWMPPFTDSVSPEGYMPGDLYNLNSKYGSVDEFKTAIRALQDAGLKVLGDTVINHRCAQFQDEHGVWNLYGGKMDWDQRAIVSNDPTFRGKGNRKEQGIWAGAPNIDHSQEFVRNDISEWLRWLRTEIGLDGWRIDYARGIDGRHIKHYVEQSNPWMCIGEYWDALDYDGTVPRHNQDAHRQRIIDWIDRAGSLSAAFDMTTKGILHAVFENGSDYWRLRDATGRAPGLMGWWPSRAVTFLENHDTGSTQGHWRFPEHGIEQGYAYILTHPGTPCVFYDHLHHSARPAIEKLLEIRSRQKLHCRSVLEILEANHHCYAAIVDGRVAVRLGDGQWQPDLGRFHFSASGHGWVVWEAN